jgi:hypothetical protein
MARKNEGLAFGDDQEDQSTQTGEGGFGSASDHPLIQAIVQAIQAHVANGGTLEGLGDAVGPAGSPTSSTSPANGPTGPSTGRPRPQSKQQRLSQTKRRRICRRVRTHPLVAAMRAGPDRPVHSSEAGVSVRPIAAA